MFEAQEPKYAAVEGRLVNRKSGMAIPADEPVFVFRAKDVYSVAVLETYLRFLPKGSPHADAIAARIEDFKKFRKDNPSRMKEPD